MSRQTPTPQRGPILPTASMVLVTLLALAGALDYYQYLSAYSHSPDSLQIAPQQQRLRDALAALPPTGAIGYLSDLPSSGGEGQVMFGIAQYELAPRLLVPLKTTVDTEWVLGNFSAPPDTVRLAAGHGLRVVADYGNGMILFRKEAGR